MTSPRIAKSCVTVQMLGLGLFVALLGSSCMPKNSNDQKIDLKPQEAVTIRSSDVFSVIVASTDEGTSVVVLEDGKPSFTLVGKNGVETATQNLYFDNREEIITYEGEWLRPARKLVIDRDPSGRSTSGYVETFVGGRFERSQQKQN